MKYLSRIVILLGLTSSLILILVLYFDDRSTNNANEQLKKELYEARQEINSLRKERNNERAEADKWYNNYIDLGNQCGADE